MNIEKDWADFFIKIDKKIKNKEMFMNDILIYCMA